MTGRRALLVVLGLVIAAYSGIPLAGYVWDDHALVERNRVLSDPTLDNVLRSDLWCCTVTNASGYYRPLLTVTYLADRWLFASAPGAAHVHSLLWHLLCVGLAWALLRPRVGDLPAAAVALLFGVHPVQSEAVVWVAARNDLMSAAGVLGALLAIDRGKPGLAFFAALAGCLSKENAYLALPLAWGWRRAWGERLDLRSAGALAAAIGVAALARSQATLGGFEASHTGSFVTPERVLNGAVTVLGWFTLPWPLTSTATLYMPATRPGAWPAAIATLGVLGAVAWKGGPRARWLLALAAFAYAPTLAGIRWYATLGERYLYLPLFFALSAVAATVRPSGVAGLVAGVAATASLVALHVRVPEWANEEVLFSAAVRRAPDAYAKNMLAVEIARQHRWAEAWPLFQDSVAAAPVYVAGCRHIPGVGMKVLPAATVAEMIPGWIEKGCRTSSGFDGEALMVYWTAGRWADVAEIAGTAKMSDPLRRISLARGVLASRDMDWAAFAADAYAWPGGASDFADRVAAIVLDRSDPTVAPEPEPL